jgi:hypothetical protein
MITQEERLHWGNHARTDSWEHLAIQKLMAEVRELEELLEKATAQEEKHDPTGKLWDD